MLYYTILYYTILYHIISYYIMFKKIVYFVMLCYVILYSILSYNVMSIEVCEVHGAGAQRWVEKETVERLLSKAKSIGLSLSNDALRALSGLPSSHAAELLEFVLENSKELISPSTYVVSTVSRGFVARLSVLFQVIIFPLSNFFFFQ